MEQIRIDLIPGGVTPNAHASQYDVGRVIRFKLYNNKVPYTLAGTETITIDITKPDGVEETITLTNTSSDYVDFITEDGLLNQAGIYECEFRITDGGDDIGTQNFNLRAEADAKGAIIIIEAQGNPAHFETDLAGALVSCIVDISYNASGYKSALVLNTSNTPTTNKTPYLFRPSYSNGYGYETLVGGTCGVNQLNNNANSTTFTVTPTTEESGLYYYDLGSSANVSYVVGHKYFIYIKTENSGSNLARISLYAGKGSSVDCLPDNTKHTIVSADYSGSWANLLRLYGTASVSTSVDVTVNVIDLTAYFGTTIADYAYTLEGGTAGAGITWLKNNGFFGADYYPYNAGGLLSVKTSKKINVGFNQWDEEWELGGINGSGQPDTATNRIRSVNFIPLVPNTTYYIKAPNNCGVYFYDDNQAFISANNYANETITPPTNARYLKFTPTSQYGTTYNNDICINISDANKNGTYVPYVSHEYPLDGSRKVHRVFDIVDLGSLEWGYDAINKIFTSSAFVDNYSAKDGNYTNFVSDIYSPAISQENLADTTKDMIVAVVFWVSYNALNIRNLAYTDAATFKTAMSGKYLCFEIDTPFDETVSNPELRGVLKLDSDNNLYYYGDTCSDFTNPQLVDGNGTEQFVDGRTVEMPVGHSTVYGEDMKARFTDFGVTVYGGEYNLTTGVLTSTKNADGTDKNPPETYQLTPVYIPVRNGDNYIADNTNGDAHVKFMKKA